MYRAFFVESQMRPEKVGFHIGFQHHKRSNRWVGRRETRKPAPQYQTGTLWDRYTIQSRVDFTAVKMRADWPMAMAKYVMDFEVLMLPLFNWGFAYAYLQSQRIIFLQVPRFCYRTWSNEQINTDWASKCVLSYESVSSATDPGAHQLPQEHTNSHRRARWTDQRLTAD